MKLGGGRDVGEDLRGILKGHEHGQHTFYEILKELIRALFIKQLTNVIAALVFVHAESIYYLYLKEGCVNSLQRK